MKTISAPLPLRGDYVIHAKGTRMSSHQHLTAQLTQVIKGTLSVQTDEGMRLVPPGRGVWITHGLPHSVYYSESSEIINCHILAKYADRVQALCRTFTVTPLLKALLAEAVDFSRPGRDNGDVEMILALILHQLNLAHKRQDLFISYGRDRRLRTAIDMTRKSPEANYSLKQLAEWAGCSERTISRLFIKETGMNYLHWRDHYRVIFAVEQLSRGFSVTRVALDLGYRGPNNFSTMFSRVMGISPKRYMASIQC
ncbi:AraC family transcriptional regulator [Acerihabitans sp. KWT182]|uniref:AraC family transcriptional regulator n=1 Tax=Acerihabitans sp. KWT182 TaxID=3157919 RepID=A0AAU7QB34_9GAMM